MARTCVLGATLRPFVQGEVQAPVGGGVRSRSEKALEPGPVRFPSWTSGVRISSPASTPGDDTPRLLASCFDNSATARALRDECVSRAILSRVDSRDMYRRFWTAFRHQVGHPRAPRAPSWSPADASLDRRGREFRAAWPRRRGARACRRTAPPGRSPPAAVARQAPRAGLAPHLPHGCCRTRRGRW
jgi:hypothetical protein